MQYSSASYKSAKFPAESRRTFNSQTLQQQQIEELEQKVDMILLHNSKLIDENTELKRLLQMSQAQQERVMARFAANDSGQLHLLRRQLEIRTLELGQLSRTAAIDKQQYINRLEQLNSVIRSLTESHEQMADGKRQLQSKISLMSSQKEREIAAMRSNLQAQIHQNSLKQQNKHKQQLEQKQRMIEEKEREWEEERLRLQQQKMNTLLKMQQSYEREREELKNVLQSEYETNIKKIQVSADEKCQEARERAEKYVAAMIATEKTSSQSDKLQDKQIESLQSSLEARQKIIQALLATSTHQKHSDSHQYFTQIQQLRKRMKEMTEHFFKQSQLLKLKIAFKHQADLLQIRKVYENRIDVLGARITILESENQKLRDHYEQEIRNKMKQRQKFEIDVSKLKNVIRKMKIELQGYGKQLRLNIQGIKSQANSFSMSILGELGQEKSRKSFYEEQIRKMREVLELKDQEMEAVVSQCEQKLKYYNEKRESNKKRIEELRSQIEEKQEKHKNQIDDFQKFAKYELEESRKHWASQEEDLYNQINELKQNIEDLQQRLRSSQAKSKALGQENTDLQHELQSAKAHIDAIKLEMEMIGQNSMQQTLAPLKEHYERIIEQMRSDKEILQQANSAQSSQMTKLVSKYKALELSLEKTLSTMKKKTELEQRVMQLGMDNNLVKNLAQVFDHSG